MLRACMCRVVVYQYVHVHTCVRTFTGSSKRGVVLAAICAAQGDESKNHWRKILEKVGECTL